MKGVLLIGLLLTNLWVAAQIKYSEIGFGYSFSNPTGHMAQTIRNSHGILIDYYVSPKGKPIAVGIEGSYNFYGQDKSTQDYTLDDGSVAPMDIIVNNNFANLLLSGRYYLLPGKIQPFVGGKLGYSFYMTSLNIYDPDDWDKCEPVDSEMLYRDGAWIGVVGGGLQWDIAPRRNPGMLMMNVSFNYTSGGNVRYMNVDSPNHNHAMHTSDVYAKFLNTQTQVVHEHHVGNVYNSWIQMMDARVMFSVRFNKPQPID